MLMWGVWMKRSGSVTVTESTELFDFVEVETADNLEVMSGELISQNGSTYLLKMTDNSAIRVNDVVILWWNREEKKFIEQ